MIRRRRSCTACGNRFTTYERADVLLSVRKRDGRVEPFDAEKIRHGLEQALADRPVAPSRVNQVVARIEAELVEMGPRLDSDDIGRLVLLQLRELDEPAYLRFASVYKDFEDAEDFEREVAEMAPQDSANKSSIRSSAAST